MLRPWLRNQPCSARLWADVVRPGAVTVLVPDLSRDVVLTPDGPQLTARTTALTRLRHDERTATAGVRLPITATDVRVDAIAGFMEDLDG